ncbi:MAG: PaaI family thioesterase [Pseudomonadota bacterium]
MRHGFGAQRFMTLLGAELGSVAPGRVEILLPIHDDLGQQHGFVHAGALWSIADSAAGFAAQSLMGPEEGVLTVELKINLLSPAHGTGLRAIGRIERAGRRLTVGRSDVYALEVDQPQRHVATALGTFLAVLEDDTMRR